MTNSGFFKIYNLLQKNKKLVLILLVLGSMTGLIYGNFSAPVFEGKVIIAGSTIDKKVLTDAVYTVEKMQYSTFFSEKTLEACKNKANEKLKNIQTMLTKETRMIEVRYSGTNHENIITCLNFIEDDIRNSENELFKFELEKKQEIYNLLKKETLQNKTFILSHLAFKALEIEISRDPTTTFQAKKIIPIMITRKPFPSPVLGAFYGSCLSLFLVIIFLLVKNRLNSGF